MHLSLLALLGLVLLCIPNLATATQSNFKEVRCEIDRRMVTFRMVFGSRHFAFFKFRRIGDNCVKVLSDESNREDSYVTQDCQRCERTHGDNDKSWRCERVPEPEMPKGKHNCRMALGADCKWYPVNKDNDSKPCS